MIYKELGLCLPAELREKYKDVRIEGFKLEDYILYRQLYTIGRTPFGDKYERDGMRKSGDANTSVGNTIINGLTHTYCFHKEYCKLNNLDMFSPMNDPTKIDNNLALLGDDNLGGVIN